ncbi:MAG: FIST N-terminal domain-containing protein [Bacteroidota bacterium]
MNVQQFSWQPETQWKAESQKSKTDPIEANLVLYFCAPNAFERAKPHEFFSKHFPEAIIVGCSTAGEIMGEEVFDDSAVGTAISFTHTRLKPAVINIKELSDSFLAGKKLGESLLGPELNSVLVISDGQLVNGSKLVLGLKDILPSDVVITGGLAGDGANFSQTLVSAGGEPGSGNVVAIGFYGSALRIGHGSIGGWKEFGPVRTITRSQDNVLYELDGQPALDLYKTYLGEAAERLPGSALEFPLMIRESDHHALGTVRTILSINEEDGSMVFAGDMPEGQTAQLMMTTNAHLVDGAEEAAEMASSLPANVVGDRLALMVSCVGRKIVLGKRAVEEVEAVAEVLGEDTRYVGFYSYGEISPHAESGMCELHNQTMTITYLAETA